MIRRSPLPALASAFAMIAGAATMAAIPQPAAAAQTSAADRPAPDAPRNEPKRGHVDVAGAAIHYQLHGDLGGGKRPLLVLHGSFMSGDAMMPLITPFTASRPVIAIDARGQGRSGGVDGELSYERMADDAAAVLAELGVKKADVLGYSMGGTMAIALAVRHPDKIDKQVILSGTSRLDGWYPEVLDAIGKLTPEVFAGSPIESEYKRLSPSPKKFAAMIEKVKALETKPLSWSDEDVRRIRGKTMVIVGDADGVTLDHAIALFKLRGGGDVGAATQGFLTAPPRARLAILPATSHVGIMSETATIATMVTPFLDDQAPPPPSF